MATSTKLKLLLSYSTRLLKELLLDLAAYYGSPYPIMLALGALKRIKMRFKVIFLPKGKGRPGVRQEIVDLIIDMKKSNWGWGALRISQELALLGIRVHKKTIQRILRNHGITPPKTRMIPPTWKSLINSLGRVWAMDFLSLFPFLNQLSHFHLPHDEW